MKYKNSAKIFAILSALLIFSFLSIFILVKPKPALATTIVLDPGHSVDNALNEPTSVQYDDPYGLFDDDYPNYPEIHEVFSVAQEVQQKLEADGYTVIMTKSEWNDPTYISLYDRAQVANNANADLAVSIHDDHTENWSSFAQVYVQNTNYFRVNKDGKHITFSQVAGGAAKKIAAESQQWGKDMAEARTDAEGHTVSVVIENFAGRAPIAAGDIPEVQLFSKVPWVYNEVGGIGITQSDLDNYAQGIVNGIEKAIPPPGGGGNEVATSNCVVTKIGNPKGQPTLPPECNTGNGSESQIVQNVIYYARSRINNNSITYIGGQPDRDWSTENPNGHDPTHFDCSGFVGWAWYWGSGGKVSMAGQTQTDWNSTNPQYEKIVTKDESQMQPGDLIYFNNYPIYAESKQPGHVGLYIGKDPGSTCSADDCFMQFYQTGLPGNEISLQSQLSKVMGIIRIKVQ